MTRTVVALLPLAITWPLGYALNAGYINLGGGEKDIIILVPWLLWASVYAIASFVYWRRGRASGQTVWRSAFAGLIVVVLASMVLFYSPIRVFGGF